MPWNNQGGGGGGPWGSPGGGGNNPWGQRPSGGPTPPDFEDMLRRGQDRVRRMVPGNWGGARAILLVLALILAGWLLTGFYRVQPDQVGVVLRFGEFSRTTAPGLHYHFPSPIEEVFRPSVTSVNRIDIGFQPSTQGDRDIPDESLMLTGDENIIDIDFTVLWRINPEPQGIRNYLFNIREPEQTVRRVAESAMREVIGQTEIQPALTEARARIEQQTQALIQDTLDDYQAGIIVDSVQLQQVDPPEQVIDAFNNVLRARQDEQRLRNEAEAYRNDVIPRARGQAERIIQEASAYREQVVAQAVGDAERFLAILASYQVAPEVTARRFYLETLEEVFAGSSKFIIDSDGQGGGNGVVPYLPLNELRRPVQQGGGQ